MGRECDNCGGTDYTAENPRVLYCRQRPSDKSDMCCVMAGHWQCFSGGIEGKAYVAQLPTREHPGSEALATGDDLERWIEGPEARALGYVFLT